jgi:hypothetical protein
MWSATEAGLVRLEGSQWKLVGKAWNFPRETAAAILLDHRGTLWVATNDTPPPSGPRSSSRSADQSGNSSRERGSTIGRPSAARRNWLDVW